MKRTALTIFAALSCALPAWGQDSPEQSLSSLKPADGIEVSLWASEPLLSNPTGIDVDSRGRVWVAEGLNYRMSFMEHSSLKQQEGADRIKILLDTDGDQVADTVKIFADNIFPIPQGLAVEEVWADGRYCGARVYVGNSPDLLVLEDLDGDDRADRRYPLLTGFHGVDSDHGLHGMSLALDGRLYFTQGDARFGADRVKDREPTFDVRDRSGRRLMASQFGTTLRVDLDGRNLEVLAYGQRNNYGASVDSYGNVFVSDNDDDGNRGCRTIWIMEGGQYGYRDPRSARHWAEELPGIIPKLVGSGNGAPAGLTVYEGSSLPAEFFHAIFQVDAGTRQVNVHPLARVGAGLRSDYHVILKSEDRWFRPTDISVAPDGSLLICDWYDSGVGGNRFSDQTTGRIYRLSSAGHTAAHPVMPDFASQAGLLQTLRSPNYAARFAARQALIARGADSRRGLLELFHNGMPHERARALFVLAALPETGKEDATAALTDEDPRIREVALQILAQDATRESVIEREGPGPGDPPATAVLSDILPLAMDPDLGVRRALLMALRNVSTDRVTEALKALARSWDGNDRFYLEALRAALRHRDPAFLTSLFREQVQQAIQDEWGDRIVAAPPYFPVATNDSFLRPADESLPTNSAAKIVGLAWALERPEALPALSQILARNASGVLERAAYDAISRIKDRRAGELLVLRYQSARTLGRRREILRQIGVGLKANWPELRTALQLANVLHDALTNRGLRAEAIGIIAGARLAGYEKALLEYAADESLDPPTRGASIAALSELQVSSSRPLVLEIVRGSKGAAQAGVLVLSAFDALHELEGQEKTSVAAQVVMDREYPLDLRRRALQKMIDTAGGVERLVGVYRDERFPDELVAEFRFALRNHVDRRVRETAQNIFPAEQPGVVRDVRSILTLPASAARGRAVFYGSNDAACSRCHRVQGRGGWVGPDLSSIGRKYGRRELLYHILNPSGAINYDYVAYTLMLEDGRVLDGLIVEQSEGRVVLKAATGERKQVAVAEIEEQRAQASSFMPDDVASKLTEQELADLVMYLATLRQPVSTAAEYYVLGPTAFDSAAVSGVPDLQANWPDADGGRVQWQRVSAAGDGQLDLTSWLAGADRRVIFCYLPVNSGVSQEAQLVINSGSPVTVLLNGMPVAPDEQLAGPATGLTTARLGLERGTNHLVIRVSGGSNLPGITTTLITDLEISYALR